MAELVGVPTVFGFLSRPLRDALAGVARVYRQESEISEIIADAEAGDRGERAAKTQLASSAF